MERVEPIVIHYEDGKDYTLEFSRETVKAAERAGVVPDNVESMPMVTAELLFFYAFKKNHPTITKEKTDSILYDDLGGITSDQYARLVALYNAPFDSLMKEGGEPKNAKVKVLF